MKVNKVLWGAGKKHGPPKTTDIEIIGHGQYNL